MSGSECLEKGRGSHVGQKNLEKAEMESSESVLLHQHACIV